MPVTEILYMSAPSTMKRRTSSSRKGSNAIVASFIMVPLLQPPSSISGRHQQYDRRDAGVTDAAVQIKTGPRGPRRSHDCPAYYLILASRNSTCLRATGSYFFLTSLSVMVREFFLAT